MYLGSYRFKSPSEQTERSFSTQRGTFEEHIERGNFSTDHDVTFL